MYSNIFNKDKYIWVFKAKQNATYFIELYMPFLHKHKMSIEIGVEINEI